MQNANMAARITTKVSIYEINVTKINATKYFSVLNVPLFAAVSNVGESKAVAPGGESLMH